MDYDAAIIGAGAAGISAARTLLASGLSAIVLEASDRIGGRAWTMNMGGLPLDMGCGWLHSAERNPLLELATAANFKVERGPTAWRSQWRDLGFSRTDQNAAEAAYENLIAQFRRDPPASDCASDALPPGGKWNTYCNSASGYLNGAPLDRLSIKDFLSYDDAASDENWRLHEGYGTLIAALLPRVPLQVSTPVRRVSLSGTGVSLDTDRGRINARAAIVTASTNVLASGAIKFDASADDHLHAASSLPLGLADKLFFELYGNHGLEAETHLLGDPQNAQTGSYYIRPLRRPVIEGFFGGTGAVVIEREGVFEAFAFGIEQLSSLLGNGIRKHLRPIAASSWCRTDWVCGSYSHALPHCSDARRILAEPVQSHIFFAGEATHVSDFSTAHGAWESGIRAANEAIAHMGKRE
jgi:monoamine oxidase